jgi:serpin B|nr:serpin family protein [Candidatus Krumholzibacteria bacterium]
MRSLSPKTLAFYLGMVLMLGAFSALGFSRGPEPMTPAEAAQSTNLFAWDLFHDLQTGEGNLFFSPASIELALVMAWNGARGETAAEMAQALRLPAPYVNEFSSVTAAFGQLQGQVVPRDTTFTLNIANRLWGQEGYSFKESFLSDLDTHFDAGLQELDFRGDSESSRLTINDWVAQKTEQKIVDLLAPGTVDASTRLVLTNAVYFLGNWQHPFSASATIDRPFFLGDGTEIRTSTMYQLHSLRYAADGLAQVLALPYKGGQVEMLIILPQEKAGLPQLEKVIDQKVVDGWSTALANTRVTVQLPRFSLRDDFSLAKVLGRLGMGGAFTSGADFSGMTGRRELAISDVIHKSFVDVDEKGTEAAAATAATMMLTSAPMEPTKVVEFIADHPFLFLIRDVDTGTILFLGRMADPRS